MSAAGGDTGTEKSVPVSVRGSMVLQGPRPQEQILHLAGELGRVSPIMREEDSSRRARHERQTQREAETGGSFKLRACVHEVHLCTADKAFLSRSSLRGLESLRYSRTA